MAVLAGEAFYPAGMPNGEDGRDRLRLSFSGNAPTAIAEGLRRLLPLLDQLPETALGSMSAGHGLRPVV